MKEKVAFKGNTLEFVYDESIEYGMKIEKILENTKRED